jgi:hypothetical protein
MQIRILTWFNTPAASSLANRGMVGDYLERGLVNRIAERCPISN